MQVPELIGGASGLGWVAVKAVLLFAVAVIGLRLGERRTLAQLSAFDFAVAVALGAIIGRGATASDTSFATSAIALVTLLVAHRVVAIGRRHSRVVRLIDHPPRVLVARGELQGKELARAGLTAADVYALLRENGVGDLGQVGYLLYETRGAVTVIGADREPGPLMRTGSALPDTGALPELGDGAGNAVADPEGTGQDGPVPPKLRPGSSVRSPARPPAAARTISHSRLCPGVYGCDNVHTLLCRLRQPYVFTFPYSTVSESIIAKTSDAEPRGERDGAAGAASR
jgi:uncharacterized membrane protein YcaP (DUF421 family)